MSDGRGFREALLTELACAGNPERAIGQQRYMKSELPFFGVTVPQVRQITRRLLRQYPVERFTSWQETILCLWRHAGKREERYAAVEILIHPRHRKWLVPHAFPLIEELVVSGAWWDHVDAIASRGAGAMLEADPVESGKTLRLWARDDNLWKRRTAILAQLKFRKKTDRELLIDIIEPSLESSEFFLAKAIGWALREYSKVEPDVVLAWVEGNMTRLKPLTRREALKHLVRTGVVAGS